MYIEDITRWHEDMNFIFEWQNNILRTSAASEWNIVFATINQSGPGYSFYEFYEWYIFQ